MNEPPSVEEYGRIGEDVFTYGSLALALAMAKDTGIMRVLCEADTPLTSSGIAQKADLKERYVREVMNALVAARLVQLAPGTGGDEGEEARYVVHKPHRTLFGQMGARSLLISESASMFGSMKEVLSANGPDSVECDHGESAAYDMFDEMMDHFLDETVEALLSAPGLRELLGCRFTLTDVTSTPLDRARKTADAQGLTNVTIDVMDLYKPPEEWKGRFDWLFAHYVIHTLSDPQTALSNVFGMLRPGGFFTMAGSYGPNNLADSVGSDRAVTFYSQSLFYSVPEDHQSGAYSQEHSRKRLEQAGFQVLGFTAYKGLDAMGATCVSQKPQEGQ
nr:hypothetical protein BaRGS_025846 [Batillaria attramentaria]